MEQPLWSLQDAKNRFSAVVEAAAKGTPQTVTKHGKPAVVIISVAEYERLVQLHEPKKPSFVEHLLAFPQGDADFEIERVKIKPRDIEI